MTRAEDIKVLTLGQAGFRFDFGGTIIYVDPYLTNRVAELEGDDLNRLLPVPISPARVCDANWILISHIHLDHCDIDTLLPMCKASHGANVLCPNEVATLLRRKEITAGRVHVADESWIKLSESASVMAVPAAHPRLERDEQGLLRYVGFVMDDGHRRIYHAGDTCVDQAIIDRLRQLGPIDVAFLPVNERNFYRQRRGIIGNMSVREAFLLGEEIGARIVVPMHWDMFAPNCVYQEEIELVYSRMRPKFQMRLNPTAI
jgi:L-ascorbate 6-phosphate lactonase